MGFLKLNMLKVCLIRIYTKGSITILLQGATINCHVLWYLFEDKDTSTAKYGTSNMKPVQSKSKDHSIPFWELQPLNNTYNGYKLLDTFAIELQ